MVEAEKILLTKKGAEELQEELRNLIDIVRPNVLEELAQARAQGDLSENADYDAARTRQAEVESRIKELEHILSNVQIIGSETKGKSKKNVVHIGCSVTYLDLSDNEEYTYEIVGSVQANPLDGKISNESALGLALLGQEVTGKEIDVLSEIPYKIIIKSFNEANNQ